MSTQPMPSKLGRYEILAELGKGAMGIVYKARDPRIERTVVIKTLRRDLIESPEAEREFVARFYREAQAAGRLSHPSIVAIHDVDYDTEQKLDFIAMEYVPGVSLQEIAAAGVQMDGGQVVEIARQIAEALDYAHACGIVHRDVKPANVLLSETGAAKLADFGIARVDASNLTTTGQVIGSPYYMSPEQITGAQVDGRSDQFSLAVVVYQLLTGKRPFEGDKISTIAYKVAHQAPIPLAALRKGMPRAASEALMRALVKAPADRYGSCRDFVAALKRALETPDIDATRERTPEPSPAARLAPQAPPAVLLTMDLRDRAQDSLGHSKKPFEDSAASPLRLSRAVQTAPAKADAPLVAGTVGRPRRGLALGFAGGLLIAGAMAVVGVVFMLVWRMAESPTIEPATQRGRWPQPKARPSGAPPFERATSRGESVARHAASSTVVAQAQPTAAPSPAPIESATEPTIVLLPTPALPSTGSGPAATVSATPTPPGAEEEPAAQGAMARVFVELEHNLKRGTITIMVDGRLSLARDFRSKERDLGPIRAPWLTRQLVHTKHTYELDVSPGQHDVTIQIVADEGVDTKGTRAVSLRAGESCTLQVGVGRVDKRIELGKRCE